MLFIYWSSKNPEFLVAKPKMVAKSKVAEPSGHRIQRPLKNGPTSLGIDSTPTIWVPNESLGQAFSARLREFTLLRVSLMREVTVLYSKAILSTSTCVQLCPKLCPSCDLCGELVEMMHVCAGKKGPPSSPQNQNHQAHPDWNNPHPHLSISKYGH